MLYQPACHMLLPHRPHHDQRLLLGHHSLEQCYRHHQLIQVTIATSVYSQFILLHVVPMMRTRSRSEKEKHQTTAMAMASGQQQPGHSSWLASSGVYGDSDYPHHHHHSSHPPPPPPPDYPTGTIHTNHHYHTHTHGSPSFITPSTSSITWSPIYISLSGGDRMVTRSYTRQHRSSARTSDRDPATAQNSRDPVPLPPSSSRFRSKK